MKAVASSTADGLRTVCRYLSTYHHGLGPTRTRAMGVKGGLTGVAQAQCCSEARVAHSSQPYATVSPAAMDLVVLSDCLIADPRLVRDLHNQGVAHLAVRVRDGTGLVGPLVIPGATSCLVKS